MTVLDLSLATSTLRNLLTQRVPDLVETVSTITVTTKRPESLQAEQNTVNLYLYHISEDPNYRNLPSPGTGARPAARTPMGLMLYYIATAQHEPASEAEDGTEQRLLGAVLKTFHDFPYIDADLSVDGGASFVMPDAMRETETNRLEVALRPVTPEESLHFWSSEQTRTARLSAYYEVRTLFMDPEKPTSYSGQVYSMGNFVSAGGAPQLTSTSAEVEITMPPSVGGGVRSITSRPARLTMTVPGSPLAATNSAFRLRGSGIVSRYGQQVILRHSSFRDLAGLPAELPLNLAINGSNGWDITTDGDDIALIMGTGLTVTREDGSTAVVPIFPGTYSVAVNVSTAAGRALTNFVSITVGPHIENVSAPNSDLSFTVTLSPAFDIARDNTDQVLRLDVKLVINGTAYERVTDAIDLEHPGQFRVSSTMSDATADGAPTFSDVSIKALAAFDASALGVHAVRVIVEGADSNPYWLEVKP